MPRSRLILAGAGLLGALAWGLLVPSQREAASPRESTGPARSQPAPVRPSAVVEPPATPRSEDMDTPRLLEAEARLGIDLLLNAIDDRPGQNAAIAPGSVTTALLMLASGTEGATRREILRPFGLEGATPERLEQAVRRRREQEGQAPGAGRWVARESLWGAAGLDVRPRFLRQMTHVFGASFRQVDFAEPGTAGRLNAWASEATRGRMDSAFSGPLDPSTLLVLLSVVDFQASWAHPFDPEETGEGPFTLGDGRTIRHPMMRLGADLHHAHHEGFHALALPYQGGAWSLYVLLPDPGSQPADVLKALRADPGHGWAAPMEVGLAELRLPRVALGSTQELRGPLEGLGVRRVFRPGAAELAPMLGPRTAGAHVQRFEHGTSIVIDERGTEASAKTAVDVGLEGAVDFFRFTVDRPFVFLIRDDARGRLRFAGVVADPSRPG